MQRLTKYSLLLKAIHKKTDDEASKQALVEMVSNPAMRRVSATPGARGGLPAVARRDLRVGAYFS